MLHSCDLVCSIRPRMLPLVSSRTANWITEPSADSAATGSCSTSLPQPITEVLRSAPAAASTAAVRICFILFMVSFEFVIC